MVRTQQLTTATQTDTIGTMISSIMPLVILMMIMGMMMPMMKGITAESSK